MKTPAFLALSVSLAALGACGIQIGEDDYPCAQDVTYSGGWNNHGFRLEGKEPSNCPPDLQAGNRLEGGALIYDDGDPDGDFGLLGIYNSDGSEVGGSAIGFVDTTQGERLAILYAEYTIATGSLCWDLLEFTVTLLGGGLEWADMKVFYAGPEALLCGGDTGWR